MSRLVPTMLAWCCLAESLEEPGEGERQCALYLRKAWGCFCLKARATPVPQAPRALHASVEGGHVVRYGRKRTGRLRLG